MGMRSSPFYCTKVLELNVKKHVEDEALRDKIISSTYVDDLTCYVTSQQDGRDLIDKLIHVCSKGGFPLHKISATNPDIIKHLPDDIKSEEIKSFNLNYCDSEIKGKMLGLHLDLKNDEIYFLVQNTEGEGELLSHFARFINKEEPLTKRSLTSTILHLWDITGLVEPLLCRGKLFIKQAHILSPKEWDLDLREISAEGNHMIRKFRLWLQELPLLQELKIPRPAAPRRTENSIVMRERLLCFSDASQELCTCAIYFQTVYDDGQCDSSLLFAKIKLC